MGNQCVQPNDQHPSIFQQKSFDMRLKVLYHVSAHAQYSKLLHDLFKLTAHATPSYHQAHVVGCYYQEK